MNEESLKKILSELEPLAKHTDYIIKIAKPSVDIELSIEWISLLNVYSMD